MRARAIGELMKQRSGLKEGLDVTMRHRRPVDLLELHDWMDKDLAPMNVALSEIWTRWDQEGVRLANDVVLKCMDLLGAATTRTQGGSGWERVRIWAAGERWTPELIAANDAALQDLARSRKRFAECAHYMLGQGPADLFAQVESTAAGEVALAEANQDGA